MSYVKQAWANGKAGNTPLSAARLNHLEEGVKAAADAAASAAPEGHTHSIANVSGLQAALDGKQASGSYAPAGHDHEIADVSGLQAALDGKQASGSYANASHTHSIANVSGLQAALDAITARLDALETVE